MRALIIDTVRDCYAPRQCPRTLTVGELQAFLEDFPEDLPVILQFDGGYTYGRILEEMVEEREFEDED